MSLLLHMYGYFLVFRENCSMPKEKREKDTHNLYQVSVVQKLNENVNHRYLYASLNEVNEQMSNNSSFFLYHHPSSCKKTTTRAPIKTICESVLSLSRAQKLNKNKTLYGWQRNCYDYGSNQNMSSYSFLQNGITVTTYTLHIECVVCVVCYVYRRQQIAKTI